MQKILLSVLMAITLSFWRHEAIAQSQRISIEPQHASMCIPEASGKRIKPLENGYIPADALFRENKKREAFQVYYQMFFCNEVTLFTGISPASNELKGSIGREKFDNALWLAYNNHFDEAVTLLEEAITTNPKFGEASYILGQVQAARGRKAEAEDAWNQTRDIEKTSESPSPPSIFVVAAQKMLDFDKNSELSDDDKESLINRGPRLYRGPYAPRLCENAISLGKNTDDGYPIADDAFRKGDYPKAFQAYYQRFFCKNDPLYVGIDERAIPGGGAGALDFALLQAVDGSPNNGILVLEAPTERDRQFGEGEFLKAQMFWALGERAIAEAIWLDVVKNPGYCQSKENQSLPVFARAAEKMLDFARTQVPNIKKVTITSFRTYKARKDVR